jgi:hypothetical protein
LFEYESFGSQFCCELLCVHDIAIESKRDARFCRELVFFDFKWLEGGLASLTIATRCISGMSQECEDFGPIIFESLADSFYRI